MKTYIVILETKFVGRHKVEIKARNDQEAFKKIEKNLMNEYNTVKGIIVK
jgi:hypothetical protein